MRTNEQREKGRHYITVHCWYLLIKVRDKLLHCCQGVETHFNALVGELYRQRHGRHQHPRQRYRPTHLREKLQVEKRSILQPPFLPGTSKCTFMHTSNQEGLFSRDSCFSALANLLRQCSANSASSRTGECDFCFKASCRYHLKSFLRGKKTGMSRKRRYQP